MESMRMLLVDDDVLTRKSVTRTLKSIVSTDFCKMALLLELKIATGLEEAKIALETQVFDVLLTDLRMPPFDLAGVSVVQHAKEIRDDMFTAIISADINPKKPIDSEISISGADMFIARTVGREALVVFFENAIRHVFNDQL